MSNLAQRVLTAIVLIPLVVAAVLGWSWQWVGVMFAALVLAGAWEWTHLANWTTTWRCCYVAATALGIAGCAYLPANYVYALMGSAAVWWAFALLRVVLVQRGGAMPSMSSIAWFFVGWVLLLPAWLSLVEIHRSTSRGPELLLLLFVLVWLADIGAYFAGRAFGRRKLASKVSPGKSWEGVLGGMVVSIAIAVAYALTRAQADAAVFVAVAFVTVAVSILGDLTESLFKRISGAKDSGGLLPGHGGVLDRIDSLTAAGPLFLLGLYLVGGA
jgi:phosphatidate cytidylyltransferase